MQQPIIDGARGPQGNLESIYSHAATNIGYQFALVKPVLIELRCKACESFLVDARTGVPDLCSTIHF